MGLEDYRNSIFAVDPPWVAAQSSRTAAGPSYDLSSDSDDDDRIDPRMVASAWTVMAPAPAKAQPACRRAVRIPRQQLAAAAEQCSPPPAVVGEKNNMETDSPNGVMNLTGEALRSEVKAARESCEIADLYIEQFQRTSDEYFAQCAELDERPHDLVAAYYDSFVAALEELNSVEIEDIPPAAGFADQTIVAEINSARVNLSDAKIKCRATIRRMKERMDGFTLHDATMSMADRGMMYE